MKNLVVTLLFIFAVNTLISQTADLRYPTNDSIQFYDHLVNHPKSPSDLADAFQFFNERKFRSWFFKDTLGIISNLRQIVKIQIELGDYNNGESAAIEALNYLDAIKPSDLNQKNKLKFYSELGHIHKKRSDYELAISYYKKALKLAKAPDDKNIIENDIALVYMEQANYEQSEKLLNQVYETDKLGGDPIQTARTLDNLGFVEGILQRPEALAHLKKALEIRVSKKDTLGSYKSYKHLSQFFRDSNQFEKAESYANKAYQIAQQIENATVIEDALSNLISIHQNSTVYKYTTLNDSIKAEKQLAEKKYAMMKIKNENNIQKDKDRIKSLLFQAIGVITLIVGVLVFTMLQSKNQKDKLIAAYLTETRISKKIHDEVANDVYHVMMKLESEGHDKDGILDELEDIYLRTRDISKGNSAIGVNENTEEILRELLHRYNTKDVKVVTRNISKIEWNNLESVQKITIYRVLQELMVNMKKHSKASIVALTFQSQGGKKVLINYTDNGVGCNVKKHSGLQNMENRITSLNGSVIFTSEPNKGFKAKIII